IPIPSRAHVDVHAHVNVDVNGDVDGDGDGDAPPAVRYRIESPIATTPRSTLHLAVDEPLGRPVVIERFTAVDDELRRWLRAMARGRGGGGVRRGWWGWGGAHGWTGTTVRPSTRRCSWGGRGRAWDEQSAIAVAVAESPSTRTRARGRSG